MLAHSSSKAQAACVSDLSFLALASILMDREKLDRGSSCHIYIPRRKKRKAKGQKAISFQLCLSLV